MSDKPSEIEVDQERLDNAVQVLMEYYDSVRIFVTRYDSEVGTVMVNRGGGNWCAQVGQVQLFLEDQIADYCKKDDEEG